MNRPAPRRAKSATATLAQVRALADPLRYRVFENLLAEPRTAKQMAERLGTHPTRLYHHFRVLERAGLIRPAGTRQKRGTTEKYFKATIERIDLGTPVDGGAAPLAQALMAGVVSSTLADLQRAGAGATGPRAAHGSGMLVKRYRLRATPVQAAEIQARLEALAEMCEAVSAPDNAREFGLTFAFYATPDTERRRKQS